MNLNEYRDYVGSMNKANGFHTVDFNLGEKLMLVTTELAECLEAHRIGHHSDLDAFEKRFNEIMDSTNTTLIPENSEEFEARKNEVFKSTFKKYVKEGVEAEIGDAMIRLFDMAYIMNIDLEKMISAIVFNNSLRPYMHGKKY